MISSLIAPTGFVASRRLLLRGAGSATLSAVAIGLLAGCNSAAAEKPMAANPGSDVDILNSALGLEYQAIAGFQRSNFVRLGWLDGHACIMNSDHCTDMHAAMTRAAAVHNLLMIHAGDKVRSEAA